MVVNKRIPTCVALAFLSAGPVWGATVTVINDNAPGVGFNDLTPVSPVFGNPGTTLGEQRLNAFQAAADVWGASLESAVEIPVSAEMIPLFCDPTSAVLGSAGTLIVGRDFPGAPRAATWYPISIVNGILGFDGAPADPDVGARFNSDVDDDPNCLAGVTWWYGIGAPAPAGSLDFFTVVLHEIAHGIGIQTFVDRETGEKFLGFDDAYMVHLEDHSTGRQWPDMSDRQRVASAIDSGDLHWTGEETVAAAGALNDGVHPSGHVLIYAPNPLELGSSTSHWDVVLAPNELMEPFFAPGAADLVTTPALHDVGWRHTPIFADGFESGDLSFWSKVTQ